jgi:hypothetical protein
MSHAEERARRARLMPGAVACGALLLALSARYGAGEVQAEPAKPAGAPRAAPTDTAMLGVFLASVRGANPVLCVLAARAVDGRGGWNGDFGIPPFGDERVRNVERAVVHGDLDATAVPTLRAALASDDACTRRMAAPLLGRVDHASAREALRQALRDPNAAVREGAALGLGFANDRSALSGLVAALGDGEERVRAMAAWALGELEQRAAVPPLVTALKDRSALVRATATRALGELEDPAAVVPLTAALAGDGDVEVRRAAAWALGEIP